MDTLVAVTTIALCIWVGNLLVKTPYFSFLAQREGRFGSIDGVRGYLAIAVMYSHFFVTYNWKVKGQWDHPIDGYFNSFGKFGVAVFFLITGFLFISKLLNAKNGVDWVRLFESRFFRIVPLYLLSVAFITVIVFINTGLQLESSFGHLLYEFARWFFYVGDTINSFADTGKINAGVDWTLRYEWLFYVLLPVIYLFVGAKKWWPPLLLFVVTLCLYLFPVKGFLIDSKFFLMFGLGGATAYLVNSQWVSKAQMQSGWVSLLALGLALGGFFHPKVLSFSHVVIIGAFFMLVALGNDLFGLLKLKGSLLLGEISYSIYLLHGIVLYVVFTVFPVIDVSGMTYGQFSWLLPVVAVIAVLVSAATYLLIEKPMIDYGRTGPLSNVLKTTGLQLSKIRRALVSA